MLNGCRRTGSQREIELGRERQERRSVISIWESSRSCSLFTAALIFSTLLLTEDSQKFAGPIGEPRREKPDLVIGISVGRGLLELSAFSGIKWRDLDLFNFSPLQGPSISSIFRAHIRSSAQPHKVPSSRYQALIIRFRTSLFILSTIGWSVKVKHRGPRGSPCWTPQQLRIVWSPRCRRGWAL